MAKYLFVYHGGKTPDSEADRARVMGAWQAWLGGLGDALVDGGAAVGMSKTVNNSGTVDGGGANPSSGYSMVEAASHDAAATMAAGCPILDDGGSVEVAEVLAM